MKRSVIIVAGGSGKRMGVETPKQFLTIDKKPLLMRTITAFYEFDNQIQIILILPEKHNSLWIKLCEKHQFNINCTIVNGGKERFDSVKNGLNSIGDNELVAIHDGARPFVSQQVIETCFNTAQEKGNAIPCVPLSESIRKISETYNEALNRKNYRNIQTPQVFRSEILKKAYDQNFKPIFTDDASVAESIGEKINLVEGNVENIKITTPFDMKIAEIIIKS